MLEVMWGFKIMIQMTIKIFTNFLVLTPFLFVLIIFDVLISRQEDRKVSEKTPRKL